MSSDDQFTSVQWDRDSVHPIKATERNHTDIMEEEDDRDQEDQSKTDESNYGDEGSIEGMKDLAVAEEGNIGASSNKELEDDSTQQSQQQGNEPPTVVSGNVDNKEKYSPKSNYKPVYNTEVQVADPAKDLDSASKAFISYLLTTKTDDPRIIKLSKKESVNEGQVEIKVRRRYGDFHFLHDCLSNDYPQVMIPPLPSKSNLKYLTGDTFGNSFVSKRLHSLNRFLRFISGHSVLSASSVFHLFLSDSVEWTTFQKNLKIKKGVPVDAGDSSNSSTVTSNVVNKVVNEELTETIMNFLTPAKYKRETNKDILEILDKLKKLYENLVNLDKLFSRLSKKEAELAADYKLFSQQIQKLAVIGNINPEGHESNSHLENQDGTSSQIYFLDKFKTFANGLAHFSDSWGHMHEYVDESFLVSIKDCAKYIISLTDLIELQHNKSIDLQVLQDYLQKAKSELSTVAPTPRNGPPSPVKLSSGGIVSNTTQLIKDTLSTSASPSVGSAATDGKAAKLQARISQLESEIASQTKIVQGLTNRIINEEYPNWDAFNKQELKSSILGLCDEQISFYEGLVTNWNDLEAKLTKRLQDLE